jgi:hypothetical protein
MFNFMSHLGLILVPLRYGDPAMFEARTPYGATAVSGTNATPPTDIDLSVARYQGRRGHPSGEGAESCRADANGVVINSDTNRLCCAGAGPY